MKLPAEFEAPVRDGIPPLGLDRDDVLLSDPRRDFIVADFGRAENKFHIKIKPIKIILRGLLAKNMSVIGTICECDAFSFSLFFYSLVCIHSLNIDENYTCTYKRSSLLHFSLLWAVKNFQHTYAYRHV
jgi:hypothetical protein